MEEKQELMAYDIKLTDTVDELLDDWDKDKAEELKSKIKKLENYPGKKGDPLFNNLKGKRELRFRRSFRIIYEVKEAEEEVIVEAVKHKDDF